MQKLFSSSNTRIIKEHEISARRLLWTAPELLKSSETLYGSKDGDIYSFGVIVQEVTLQEEPFAGKDLSPEAIVQRIKEGDRSMRPEIPDCNLLTFILLIVAPG